MKKGKQDWIELDALGQAAECLKILAHPHRLRFVEMLLVDKFTVGELAESVGVASHVASMHLRLMQRCALLEPIREGRKVYYRIAESCLADILKCIRKRFGSEEHQRN